MTVGTRLMALGLVGSAGLCVVLATQVSATPPPGEEAPTTVPTVAPAPCKYLVEIARNTLASHGRLARMRASARPDDFVAAMRFIETHDDEPERVLDARSTLARCGESVDIDPCFDYVPDTAESLARDTWESEGEWQRRVERANAEAKACGATLPEAKDPGPDCSPAGVEEMRVWLARTQRARLADRVDGSVRVTNQYRSHLTRCGYPEPVDPCYGTSHEELMSHVELMRDILARNADEPRIAERWRASLAVAEREAALCPK